MQSASQNNMQAIKTIWSTWLIYLLTVTISHSYLNVDAVERFAIYKIALINPRGALYSAVQWTNDIRESCYKNKPLWKT